MKLVSDLLIILTIVIPLIFISLSVFFGFKRNIYQSLAKLGMTIFAIAFSVLITKIVVAPIALPTFAQLANLSSNTSSALINGFSRILAALFMPAVFTAVFSLVSLICLILYLTIPKKKLTDAKIAEMKKRKATVSTPDTAASETKEPVEATPDSADLPEADKAKAKKVWLRVGCVALSVFSVILVLAHFAMPVSFYSKFAEDTLSSPLIQEVAGDEILPVCKFVSNYPTVKAYRVLSAPANWCFDAITVPGGGVDSARGTINALIQIVDSISNTENALKREDFYAISEIFNEKPYLDYLFLQTAKEIVDAWSKGEDLLGLSSNILTDGLSIDTLKQCVEQVDSAAELFHLLGDLITLPEILDGGVTPDALSEVFVQFDIKSIAVLEQVVLDGVKNLDKFPVNVSEDLISSVFSAILEIRADDSIPADEKAAILTAEAESLNVFLSILDNPKKAEPSQVGKAIAQSKAISDALIAATEGGSIKDPCGFGKALTTSFTKKVRNAMEKEGISKDSELYKSASAFFSNK